MNFEAVIAMMRLKPGLPLRRKCWPEDMHIELQTPDENSKMTAPYLFISVGSDYRIPWVPTCVELFATDWTIVDHEPIGEVGE